MSLHRDLAGYVVLLHFWNGCSINCLHVEPTLRYLEQLYSDRPFLVVGVHSGKFAEEHEVEHVRSVVRQLGVRHPVVVDRDLSIWRSYDARSWPTLVLVDATQHIRFLGSGEPDRDKLAAAVEVLLDEAIEQGDVLDSNFPLAEHEDHRSTSGLWFPSKLAVDPERNTLWISDTGNHRVVAVNLTGGEVTGVFGNGSPGASDGKETARFCAPRGIAVDWNEVFVADTGNHLVRRIQPGDGAVDTVLGQGRQVVDHAAGQTGSDQGLNSPSGLAMAGDDIVIAMAGDHQLWAVNKDTMTAEVLAGHGGMNLVDGPGDRAALAQPSGVSCSPDGRQIVFADSGTSAVRILDREDGQVQTVIGKGLFDFGDVDGPAGEARLQFPCDVVFSGSEILIADTLNHKIKRLDLETQEISTLIDTGLRRPEGLAVDPDRGQLFVADTGNHRILQIDLADGSCSVLEISGLPEACTAFGSAYRRAAPCRAVPIGEMTMKIPIEIPDGARLHPEAPMTLRLENLEGHPLLVDMTITPNLIDDLVVADGISTAEDGEGIIRIRLSYMTCHELDHVCHVHEARFDLPITLAADGEEEVLVAC